MKIAQGKRGTSVARGKARKTRGGILRRFTQGDSRCAPLPWATIFLPLRGGCRSNSSATKRAASEYS